VITQRKIRVLLAAMAVGAVTAGIIHAAPAHADTAEDDFLKDVHSIGFNNPDELLLDVGYSVCDALEAGNSSRQIAYTIYINTDLSVSKVDAVLFTLAAEADLCPAAAVAEARKATA